MSLTEAEILKLLDMSESSSDGELYGSYDSDNDPEFHVSSDSDNDSSDTECTLKKKCKKQKPVHVNCADVENRTVSQPVPEGVETIAIVANTVIDAEVSNSTESVDELQCNEVVNNTNNLATSRMVWSNVTGNLNDYIFSVDFGIRSEILLNSLPQNKQLQPVDVFNFLIDEEVLTYILKETNRYAEQKIVVGIANESITKYARITLWNDINLADLKQFLGMIVWMGLDQKPELQDYWSQNILYQNKISSIMSRNKFELILSHLHFCDNKNPTPNDKLYKISNFVKIMNNKFQKAFVPGEVVCLDETMIPFRGRLSFRQYIPGKRFKYGIKMYKLCSHGGYTWNTKIYCGKETTGRNVTVSTVFEIMEPLLKSNRTLCTDNFYTSVTLAHLLMEKKTHLVGTLRGRRQFNPKAVVNKKLRRGEMYALQNNSKVIVGKWRDKRDVLFLTTKHKPELVDVNTKRGIVKKPNVIVDYNNAKSYIDLSDQRKSYGTPVRKSIKWYRKVAIELMCNTAMVNALYLYEQISGVKTSITKFRESVAFSLLETENQDNAETSLQHVLIETEKRGRCNTCYNKLSTSFGRQHAIKHTKQTSMKCAACDTKFMCIKCFFELHAVKKL